MAIEYKTRTQLVAEAIREKILSGELKGGEPVRQAALAEELEVSRIPVREALLLLESEGLVNFEAHKGATVTELSLAQIDEVFDLRALLESDLLRHSIPHLSQEDLLEAHIKLKQLELAIAKDSDYSAISILNKEFHFALYAGANRPETKEIAEALNSSAERYVRMHLLLADGLLVAPNEHQKLYDLCEKRSVEAACDCLKQHIQSAKEDIKALLHKAVP